MRIWRREVEGVLGDGSVGKRCRSRQFWHLLNVGGKGPGGVAGGRGFG